MWGDSTAPHTTLIYSVSHPPACIKAVTGVDLRAVLMAQKQTNDGPIVLLQTNSLSKQDDAEQKMCKVTPSARFLKFHFHTTELKVSLLLLPEWICFFGCRLKGIIHKKGEWRLNNYKTNKGNGLRSFFTFPSYEERERFCYIWLPSTSDHIICTIQ